MSFSDSSSLDLSIDDLDLEEEDDDDDDDDEDDDDDDDDEYEPPPIIIKKKKKHKKKRPKKRKVRRRRHRFILPPPETFEMLPPEESETAAEIAAVSEILSSVSDHEPTLTELLNPEEDLEREEDEEKDEEDKRVDAEFEKFLEQQVKDHDPEQIGIIKILMKRRRARAAERKLPLFRAAIIEKQPVVPEVVSEVSVSEEQLVREVAKPEQPKFISCKFINTRERSIQTVNTKPGPGQYEYYSTIGYIGHDPTRKRAPDFSFGRRTKIPVKRIGPGPKYNIRNFTMRGKEKPKSLPFGKKKPPPEIEITPGPADYNDQSLYLAKKPRSAILYGRPEEKDIKKTPVAIGELTFMGNSKPAACLIGKPKAKKPNKFPSPLSYAPVSLNVYMTKGPSITMGYNRKPPKKDADFFPTVGTYHPNYDYFLKKRNIVIPTSNGSCVNIPMDLPEKKIKK